LLAGSTHVTPEHVKAVAKPVLRHRLLMNFNAEADQVTSDDVIDELLAQIPVEGLTPGEKRKMDEVVEVTRRERRSASSEGLVVRCIAARRKR